MYKYLLFSVVSIFVFADPSDIVDDIPNQLDNVKQVQVVEESEPASPSSDCEEKSTDKKKKSYSDKLKTQRYEFKRKYKKYEKQHQNFAKKFVKGFRKLLQKGKNLGK